jgi:hypothetical protein
VVAAMSAIEQIGGSEEGSPSEWIAKVRICLAEGTSLSFNNFGELINMPLKSRSPKPQTIDSIGPDCSIEFTTLAEMLRLISSPLNQSQRMQITRTLLLAAASTAITVAAHAIDITIYDYPTTGTKFADKGNTVLNTFSSPDIVFGYSSDGVSASSNWEPTDSQGNKLSSFAAVFTGNFLMASNSSFAGDGKYNYNFAMLTRNDGCQLLIDGIKVIDMDQLLGYSVSSNWGWVPDPNVTPLVSQPNINNPIALTPGIHSFTVNFFSHGGGAGVSLGFGREISYAAVPEPATTAAILSGLTLVAAAVIRRRKQA